MCTFSRKLRYVQNQIIWLINEMKYREAFSSASKLNNSYCYSSVNVFGSTWDLYLLEHVCSLTRSRFSIFQFALESRVTERESKSLFVFKKFKRFNLLFALYNARCPKSKNTYQEHTQKNTYTSNNYLSFKCLKSSYIRKFIIHLSQALNLFNLCSKS